MLSAFGEFVETLGGRYITAGDIGTTAQDMDIVGTATRHVVARSERAGGSGDSAPLTARGVYRAMQAAAGTVWGAMDLTGCVVGVEGVGKVGRHLAGLLTDAGATVVATDVNPAALAQLQSALPATRTVTTQAGLDLDPTHPVPWGNADRGVGPGTADPHRVWSRQQSTGDPGCRVHDG